jgi:hypothetical protein
MGHDNDQPPAQNQPVPDQPVSDQPISDQSIQDQSISGAVAVDPGADEASLLAAAQGQLAADDLLQSAADDLLHAAHVPPPDMVANVEFTLDHLSSTVDLFDVPPFDYGDAGGGDTG